jgi:transcription-repair coupling factor (superfamily II helicase)
VSQDLGAALVRGLRKWEKLAAVAAHLRQAGRVDLVDTAAASRPAIVSTLWAALGGQLVVWTASTDRADRFANDCSFYTNEYGSPVQVLRPRDETPNALTNPAERAGRITFLDALAAGEPGIYCVSHAAARQPLAQRSAFLDSVRVFERGGEYRWEATLAALARLGYERVEVVSAAGEFAVRGGIIDVFPASAEFPVRLEFFGDRLEQIRTFAIATQRSLDELPAIRVTPWSEEIFSGANASVWDYAAEAIAVVDDPQSIAMADQGLANAVERATVAEADQSIEEEGEEGGAASDESLPDGPQAPTAAGFPFEQLAGELAGRAVAAFCPRGAAAPMDQPAQTVVSLHTQPAQLFNRNLERFIAYARTALESRSMLAIASVGYRRIREVLEEHDVASQAGLRQFDLPFQRGAIVCAEGAIDAGFEIASLRFALVGDNELYGHPARRHRRRAAKEGVPITAADLHPGDYFVHAHHGIGQYLGLDHITVEGLGRDFMQLAYAGSDRLYVPVDQMHLVRKYTSADGAQPRLSKLGGSDWTRTRARVREAVERIAEELVRLSAAREVAAGHPFAPDTPWQAELEESFPYDETPDQAEAIRVVKDDMERPRPMDRLICGDVGYGKTEVAVRAAFKAIMDRRQVALLTPTTVLAAQHFRTFCERFAAYPVTIAMLSRFRSKGEQRKTLAGLADGSIDLVIGTHRLLQRDVGFKQLGLVIVDEEQRFGVMHKERLKDLRRSVDVLTLSATPIPRTLHMAMAGVRDLSLITTPPANRMSIRTVVAPSSDGLIAAALETELERGGQVYFVHNRIESIYAVADAVAALAPRARIAVGHGKMHMHELEDVMLRFVNGELDILVSTTIIENGLDIPNVNTIIVNNADRFGLAQLYQLRGRVGRSAHQAYAYFLYQPHRRLSDVAQARLEAIREFSHLGSGLQLAMRDLEIRGAGNLLGREQSGFIAAVGFDTYCQILQETVAQRRGQAVAAQTPPPVLDVRVSAYIPSEYIRSSSQKISFYQRIAAAQEVDEIDRIAEELRDRFGPLPDEVLALLDVNRVRVLATAKGVQKVALEQRRLTLEMGPTFTLSEQALPALAKITGGNFRFTRDAIVVGLADAKAPGRLASVREIVSAL